MTKPGISRPSISSVVSNPLDIEAPVTEYPDVGSHLYMGPFEWCLVCRGTEEQLKQDVEKPLTLAGLACHISEF